MAEANPDMAKAFFKLESFAFDLLIELVEEQMDDEEMEGL